MSSSVISAAVLKQVDLENAAFDRLDRTGNPLQRYASFVRPLQVQFGSPSWTAFCDEKVVEIYDEIFEEGVSLYLNEHANEMIDLLVQADVVTRKLKTEWKRHNLFDAPSPLSLKNGSFLGSKTGKHYRQMMRDNGFSSNSSIALDTWPRTTISNKHPSKTRRNSLFPDLVNALEKDSIVHIFGVGIAEVLVPSSPWGLFSVARTSTAKSHFVFVGNHPGVIRRDQGYWLPKIERQVSTSLLVSRKIATREGVEKILRECKTYLAQPRQLVEPDIPLETFKPTPQARQVRKEIYNERRGDVQFGGNVFFNEKVYCNCQTCRAAPKRAERTALVVREWYRVSTEQHYLDTGKVKCANSNQLSTSWYPLIPRGITPKYCTHGDAHGNHKNKGAPQNGERTAQIKAGVKAKAAAVADETDALLAQFMTPKPSTSSSFVSQPSPSKSSPLGSSSQQNSRASGSTLKRKLKSSVVDLPSSEEENEEEDEKPKKKKKANYA